MKSKVGEIPYKVLYAEAVYGNEEKLAVLKSMDNQWLAAGPKVKEFEEEIAKLFGHQYGVATNSGSSANLLAFESLDLPEGGEVITPACTFSTVVSSIIQNNLVPVFVDSVVGRYTMDEDLVEAAITPKTVAIMAPHLIGGVADLRKLRAICDAYNLFLIDDSCDTLGATIDGKPTGHYSDISTTSFYGSHIITALGYGGMLCMSNRNSMRRAITFKDWGRIGGDNEDFEKRFDYSVDDIPYDAKFLYSDFGYNLKMNEAAAAFGLIQLQKLQAFSDRRAVVFNKLYDFFKDYEKWFHLPHLIDGATTNWLAFPLTIKKAPFTRKQLLAHLEKDKIQTRVLFSGNITRHPAYRRNKSKFVAIGEFPNADKIMKDGFLLGCHQGMDDQQVEYLLNSLYEFLNEDSYIL